MADLYFVVCEKGHFTQEIVLDDIETPLIYLINDKYKFVPLTTIAWCFSCNRVERVEELPPLDAIEGVIDGRVLSIVTGLDLWLGYPVFDEVEHKSLDHNTSLKIKLEWRLARQSQRRCLECGSTNLDFGTKLPDGSQYFLHPDCGGRCEVKRVAHALEIYSGMREWPLSGEGEHLTTIQERGSLPSSAQIDEKLITFLMRLQRPKTIGGFSTSHRGVLGPAIIFVLITSLPLEYVVETWIPHLSNAQQHYVQAKDKHQNPELLPVGDEAFAAIDVQENNIAMMRHQNIIVSVRKSKPKSLRHFPQLVPTILTKAQVVNIFEEILNLLMQK